MSEIANWVCFRQTDLDFPDHLHLFFLICLWELIDFDFVLQDFFHDLHTAEYNSEGHVKTENQQQSRVMQWSELPVEQEAQSPHPWG